MITYGILLALSTPVFWVLDKFPALPSSISSTAGSVSGFYYQFLNYAVAWQNWIPIHLIASLATAYFSLWAATIALRFFRVIYSMLFGGGGSL